MPEWLYLASWVFLIGGIAGTLLESGWEVAVERRRRFESRAGILPRPVNPVPVNPLYGAAAVLGSFALGPLAPYPGVVVLLGAAILTVVEYAVSLVLERAFGTVLWDYSERPLHLHGRICLEFTFYWGVLSLALVYVVDPALRSAIALLPRPAGDAIAITLLAAAAAALVARTAGFAGIPRTNLSARYRRLLADPAGRSGHELTPRPFAARIGR